MAIFNSYVSWDLQKNHWPFSENADELCFPLYFFFIFQRKPMLDGFEKIGGPGVPNNVWFDGRWTENLRPNGQTLISNTTMEEGSFVDDLAKKTWWFSIDMLDCQQVYLLHYLRLAFKEHHQGLANEPRRLLDTISIWEKKHDIDLPEPYPLVI